MWPINVISDRISKIYFPEGLFEYVYTYFNALQQTCLKSQRNKVKKKEKIRNRYNQEPHLTRHTLWESDKNKRKRNIQESQEVSPFPEGGLKATMNRRDSIIKTNVKHEKEAPPLNG